MSNKTVQEIIYSRKSLEERKADLLERLEEIDPKDKIHQRILISMLNAVGVLEATAEEMGLLDLIPSHANPRAPRAKRLTSFAPSVPCMTAGQARQAIDFLKRTIPEITAFNRDNPVFTPSSSGPKSP